MAEEIEKRIYKSILIKELDSSYLGFNPSNNPDPKLPDIPAGFLEVEWDKELPEDTDNLIYDATTGTLNKRSQVELDALEATIVKQKDIDAKQDVVMERLAGAVNNILKFIEAENTLTAGQQTFVDNFCSAYNAWTIAKEKVV